MPGPRRSQGCYRCRRKKVKCDEERPACKRCLCIGLECPGYRPENELLFMDMSQRIENKVLTYRNKPKGSRSQRDSTALLHSNNPTTESNEKSEPQVQQAAGNKNSQEITKNLRGPILYKSMSTDWQDRALCRFFSDYIVNTNDLTAGPGFLHNLPLLVSRTTGNDSVLLQAVTAVALSNFSNQVGSEDLLITARKCYGRGLVGLHGALTEGRLTSDETLGGCLLLNMYEMFSGDRPLKSSVWETHGDALGMLLRVRGTVSQFTDPICGGITRGAHRVILFKNLLKRTAPGLESKLWEESMDFESPWALAQLALNRIAHLLPVADSVLRDDLPSMQRLLKIIEQLQKEDQNFWTWSIQHGTISAEEDLSRDFESEKSPQGSFANGTYNIYRAGRIFLLQALLSLVEKAISYEILSYMADPLRELQQYTQKEIVAMANDISVSTEFVVADLQSNGWAERRSQDVKPTAAYTSVFPLKVALSVKTLTKEHRNYVEGQLQSIERTLGLKIAETIRTTS